MADSDINGSNPIIAVVSSQNGGKIIADTEGSIFNAQTKNLTDLSIAKRMGGTYTEGLTIQSNAGDIVQHMSKKKESDKDIIFKVDDGGTPTEVMRRC